MPNVAKLGFVNVSLLELGENPEIPDAITSTVPPFPNIQQDLNSSRHSLQTEVPVMT